MKVRPEAVVIAPPWLGTPNRNQNGQGASSRVVPSGTSHTFLPVVMSIPASLPQGGALQGAPKIDMMSS